MPQLDIVAYVAHYIWTLIFLFIYFFFLVNLILPKLQQQIAIRNRLSSTQEKKEISKSEIFKTLFQIDLPQKGSNYR